MNELRKGCVVCGTGYPSMSVGVAEAMYRTGESFDYRLCGSCGSLQIAEVPDDIGRFYQETDYYSFSGKASGMAGQAWLRAGPVLAGLRVNSELFLRYGIGRGIYWARSAGLRPGMRILDIGAGSGENLLRLYLYGFRNLQGVDPFLSEARRVAGDVWVRQASHEEMDGQFDCVMLHHVFEHVCDPRAMLRSVGRVLSPGGVAIIRVPIMGTYAWRTYGVDWVQIDAPRHVVVYSLAGLQALASEAGFLVERVFFDSTEFQFWGSELVRQGIPHGHKAGESIQQRFTVEQRERWGALARRLNAACDGDQAGLVLRRA